MLHIRLSTIYIFLFTSLFLLSCNGSGESLPILEAEEISKALENPDNIPLLSHQEEVQAFYKARSNKPFWTTQERRQEFLDEVLKVENDGLDPKDYLQDQIQELREKAHESREDQARYEILLSDAFFKVAQDLYYGRLNPKELHWIWDVERESQDFSQLLETLEETGNFEKIFAD